MLQVMKIAQCARCACFEA